MHPQSGKRQSARKLSPGEVDTIRCESAVGVSLKEIAGRHGISWEEADGIISRALYQDVPTSKDEVGLRRHLKRVRR